jgi:hypothetical protein
MTCAGGIVVSGLPAFAKPGDIKRVVSARTGATITRVAQYRPGTALVARAGGSRVRA